MTGELIRTGLDRMNWNQLADRDFWLEVNPKLSITDNPFDRAMPALSPDPEAVRLAKLQLSREGYFKIQPLIPGESCGALAAGVAALVARGLPPVFVSVYDEFWRVLALLAPLYEGLTEGSWALVPDYWVWHVDGQWESSGWQAHRDMEVDEPYDAEGRARLLTIWLPFSDATIDNSCIYVLPTNCDPYLPAEGHRYSIKPGAEKFIRALPVLAGGVLGWNQSLLHWGSARLVEGEPARINVGIYLQRLDCGEDFFGLPQINCLAPLDLGERLGMVGRMVIKYRSKYPFPPGLLDVCARFERFWRTARALRSGLSADVVHGE